MNFNLQNLVRANIRRLVPYSSARKEFAGGAEIFLDANENNFGSPLAANYNRYPDPLQTEIKAKIAEICNVDPGAIFIGNGSDEAIDLLFRIFCAPGADEAIICPPTYGMYRVSASINDVRVKEIFLTPDFQLDVGEIRKQFSERTKLLFICSPNNPTGNAMPRAAIMKIAESFPGVVVVDEAYIHFSNEKSMIGELENLPNLVVLQTFSKAWGLAGLRIGAAFASAEIVALFNLVKPPYNVSQIAQEAMLVALENRAAVERTIAEIISEREKLIKKLAEFAFVRKIYPTEANFVLVKTTDAEKIYKFLLDKRIVVRNRSSVELCADCLRITIGTARENARLIETLKKL